MAAVATRRPERQDFSPRCEGNNLPSSAMGISRKVINRNGGMRIWQRLIPSNNSSR